MVTSIFFRTSETFNADSNRRVQKIIRSLDAILEFIKRGHFFIRFE